MRGQKRREVSTIKSARRVLEVLELFSRLKEAATVSEIQSHLKYPQSSTSVLLKSLHALGYLDYDPIRRRYMPTMRVNLLGAWMQSERLGGVNMDELLRRLRHETGESVVLAMQNGVFVQYIHMLHTSAPLRVHIDSGVLRPLGRTAAGKMLLTLKSPTEVRGLVRRINAGEIDAVDRIDAEALLQELERCRRRGHVVNLGNGMPGIGAIAMLLPLSSGLPPMAVSVVGIAQQIAPRQQQIIETMTRVLREYAPGEIKDKGGATADPHQSHDADDVRYKRKASAQPSIYEHR